MVVEPGEWTVPPALRALLWWPAVSFVLVLAAPDAAAGSIALSGLVLVALGAVATALRRRPVGEPSAAVAAQETAPSARAA